MIKGTDKPKIPLKFAKHAVGYNKINFTVNLLEIAFFRELRVFVSCEPLKPHDFVISLKKGQ